MFQESVCVMTLMMTATVIMIVMGTIAVGMMLMIQCDMCLGKCRRQSPDDIHAESQYAAETQECLRRMYSLRLCSISQ